MFAAHYTRRGPMANDSINYPITLTGRARVRALLPLVISCVRVCNVGKLSADWLIDMNLRTWLVGRSPYFTRSAGVHRPPHRPFTL